MKHFWRISRRSQLVVEGGEVTEITTPFNVTAEPIDFPIGEVKGAWVADHEHSWGYPYDFPNEKVEGGVIYVCGCAKCGAIMRVADTIDLADPDAVEAWLNS